jgi:Holliday junction resolvase
MSGRAPRRKGDRLERELVKHLEAAGIPAKRVPLSGSARGYPGDITATLPGLGEVCLECKSRRAFATLYKWLEYRDALVLKADRKEPLMVLRLSDFLKVLGGLSDAALIEASQPGEHELDDEAQA